MFDSEIELDSLQKIRKALETIIERAAVVDDPNDFLCSPGGMLRLDAIFLRKNVGILRILYLIR